MRTHSRRALCALLGLCFVSGPLASQDPSAARQEAEKLAQMAREASVAQADASAVEPPAEAVVEPTPEPTPTPVPSKSPLNLNNADLNTVLKYISSKTGKPVVFGAGITPEVIEKKKITIINPAEQTDEQNLALLYRVLSHQDIAVVDEDDILVVQILEGKRRPNIPIVTELPDDSRLEVPITQARELENILGGRILESLRAMVRNPEALQYDRPTNTLYYTDTRSYVEKFLFLVNLFDREPKEGLLPRVKQITHVSAETLVEPSLDFLENYAQAIGRETSKTMVKPEPLTNSLIIRGPTNEVEALLLVVTELDKETWRSIQRVTTVRPVGQADPDDLIRRAKKYLSSYVAIHGDPGEIPLTVFRYDSAKRELILRGPQAEIDALNPLLERWDPALEERTRTFSGAADRDSAIREALDVYAEERARKGLPEDVPGVEWETDRFDPRRTVFRGPADALSDLFQILDRIDKPVASRKRAFYSKTPEVAIPEAENLLVRQYEEDGYLGFEPSIRWRQDLLDPTQYEISAPSEELDRLMAILDKIDPATTVRTRSIVHATPEVVIPAALDIILRDQIERGRTDYETLTTWERDRWDPRTIRFEGPPQELTELFAVLDRLDKPMVRQRRTFYSKSPEAAMAEAERLLIRQFEEEGFPNYEPSIRWRQDLLDPTHYEIFAPQEEMTRLTTILNKIDPATTLRTRSVVHATPETIIPAALDIVLRDQIERGRTDYETLTTWERDRWDPRTIRFEGPPDELTQLFAVLDQLDKPRTVQNRRFHSTTPERAIPEALSHLEKRYAEEGRPDYRFSIEWDRDPLDPSTVRIKGPADETAGLIEILDRIDKPIETVRRAVVNEDPKSLISPALSLLRQHFVDHNQPERRPEAEIRFDEVTGGLILRGPAEEIDVLEEILTDLDRAQWQHQSVVVQKFSHVYAQADDLIAAASSHLAEQVELQGEYGDRPGVAFRADELTKSILLYGPSTQIAICLEVMEAIEANTRRGLKPVVIYTDHVPPSVLSSELSAFIAANFAPEAAPSLQVNDRLGALFVTGRDESTAQIRDWVRLFDVPRDRDQTQRIVKLKNAEAGTLAGVLNQLQILSPDGRLVPETQSNSLVIVDATETIDRLMPFIEELDSVATAEDMVYRVFKTKTAHASYLQSALNQYAQQIASQQGRSARNRASVTYEPYSGSIIVFGLESDVEQIVSVAAEFDKIEFEGKKPEFIYLENADAQQVYSTLSSLLSNISPTQSPSLVIPETRINALIVVAEEEILGQVREIVAKIDVETEESQEFRVIPIKNVSSSQIYSVVNQMLVYDYTGSKAPYVTYEHYSNSLVVRAHPDDFPKVEKLIEQLDIVSDKQQEVRLFKLEHASAPQIYSVVSSLLANISTALTSPYVTYLNESTLVVRAQTDQFAKVEEILKEFDIPKTSDQEYRVFDVRHISSSQAYNAVYYMLIYDYTGSVQPYVTYSGNQLFVRAHKNDFEKVEKLLSEIDRSQTADYEFRVIPIQFAEPSQAYYAVLYSLQSGFTGAVQPYVTYAGTNLFVRAHKDDFAKLEKLLKEIDVSLTADYEFRVIPVKFAEPSQAYYAVYYMLQSKYTGSVQPYVNYVGKSLFVRAHKDDFTKIDALLAEVDVSGMEDQEIRVITTRNAPVYPIYLAVNALLTGAYTGTMAPYITYDTANNNLILRAHKDDFARVEEIVARLDVSPEADYETRVLPVTGVNAGTLVGSLRHIMVGQNVTFFPDVASNSIVARGRPQDIRTVEEIIDRIGESGAEIALKVRPLENANYSSLSGALTQFLSSRYTQQGGVGPQTGVYPDSTANSIYIYGPTEEVEIVYNLIGELDIPAAAEMEVRIYTLASAEASTVAGLLSSMLSTGFSGSTRPYVTSDTRNNAVILSAHPNDFRRAEEFIKQLEETGENRLVIRIVKLQNTNPQTLVQPLSYMTTSRGRVTADPQGNAIVLVDSADSVEALVELVRELDVDRVEDELLTEARTLRFADAEYLANSVVNPMARQKSQITGLRAQQTYAFAEPNSNTLIIVGASEEVRAYFDLVAGFDTAGSAGGEVRLFQLRYTEATTLANQFDRLFRTQSRSRTGVQTSVVADPETNSLIAIGTEVDMNRLKDLIAKLDVPDAGGLEVRVFALDGVAASTLASYLQRMAGPKGQVFPDPTTNSLVVYDTPEFLDRIEGIVEQLSERGFADAFEIRNLKHAQAAAIVSPINSYLQMRAQRGGTRMPAIGLYPETSSNSVLIFGPTNEIQIITSLIDKLDVEGILDREPAIFPLRYLDAERLARELESLLVRARPPGAVRPAIVAERNSNTLLVLAEETEIQMIRRIIDRMDVAGAEGLETVVITLRNSSAQELAQNLRPPLVSGRGVVFADPNSNSLVVTDTTEGIQKIRDLVETLDGDDREMVYEVRPLENTTFQVIQSQLDQFLQHQARLRNLRQPLTQVMGDPNANSAVIFGPSEEVALVMGLIDRIDAESLYDRVPRIFYLEKAQAQEVATLLQQILLAGRGRRAVDSPRVQAYPETNSVVVIAPEADMRRVGELISELDQPRTVGLETRIFPLRNANPTELLSVLSPLVGQPTKLSADPQSRIVIYTDTKSNLDELGAIISQLDEISAEGEIVPVVRALKNTDAATVSSVLSQYAAQLAERKGRPTPLTRILPDPVGNSVTIVGPTDEVSLMSDLLVELDAESLHEREIRIYYLERTSAVDAAREINLLMRQLSRGPNAPRIGASAENNALVVVATPADRALIERIIEGIDQEGEGVRRTEIIPLQHAVAQNVLQTLTQMVGPSGTLGVHVDSNSIVYTDTEANILRMRRIVEDLDSQSRMEDVVQKVVVLKNTNAGSITTPLQNIIAQVSGFRAKGSKPPTQIYPELEANAVVIVGASEDVSQLSRIVAELDAEAMYERSPSIIFLERARARDVATELTQLFAVQRSNRTPPRIVANEWANALMVIADPQDAKTIEKVALELDTSEGNKRVVEIFILKNSDAASLSQRLRDLFQEGGRTSATRQSGYYGFYGAGGGRRSEGLTEGEIGITADLRLNALIVTAEPQDMEQVAELIDLLDMESPFSGEPKVYPLKNAEAEALAETLNNLFSDTDYVRGRFYTETRDVTISGLSGRVRVMSVPQTNSLIVLASSPNAFETVEALIKELDVPNERAGKTQVIKVDNADVLSLKTTLEELFKPEDRGAGRSTIFFDDFFGGFGGGGAAGGDAFSNLIGKVRIQADTRTSSLLVVTPEVYFPAVEQIVKTLDVPTKQVMLKVLIAEITRNNQRELGFQWGVDPNTGEVGRISINNTEIFHYDNDRGDVFSPLSNPSDLVTGGFTDAAQFFSLNQTQFGTVINFLQSCQDVTVKQSPMIIAADNERAYIKVGQRTPFVSDISAVGGQINTSVEYQEIGLTLEVTPKINSETTVTLNIKLTDGAIDPSVPALAGSAATFTDRMLETSPIVNNRNTVVLGGVIFDRENEQVDEVPFLHRLPVVGDKVFTNRGRRKETVELITFITPYILNDDEDARMATEMVRSRSNDRALQDIDLRNGDWPVEYVEEGERSSWPER